MCVCACVSDWAYIRVSGGYRSTSSIFLSWCSSYVFYLHVCVCRCLYRSVHQHVAAQGFCWGVFLPNSPPLLFWGRIFQSNAKLTHIGSLPRELALWIPSLSFKAGIIGTCPSHKAVHGFWGSELLFSCLPHNHFNHWVTSLPSTLYLRQDLSLKLEFAMGLTKLDHKHMTPHPALLRC